ncbi:heparinase II/III family protein [Candidatus Pseudothioglobus singularis]|nr:heparinase II/III family protein [Candidatus Pseudothioglobus singularis]
MKEILSTGVKYWHTIRFLRFVQIIGRFRHLVRRPRIDNSPAKAQRVISGNWIMPARRRQSMVKDKLFCFLNETHQLSSPDDWNNKNRTKLWLYNLHYFDDLCALDADQRVEWHRALISLWIKENPAGIGNGWEPYPTSLRIVNWIKWTLAGNSMEEHWLQSLTLQTRYLYQNLETHIMGNHLFANAKALLFAGSFFDGNEAKIWRDKGRKLIEKELEEQLLNDGGNFELSTMYHMIFLEDLLDLYNIIAVYKDPLFEGLEDRITLMFNWLSVMCHPDGEISFFNDAAFGITPSVIEVNEYRARILGDGKLTFSNEQFDEQYLIDLPISGYSRVSMGDMVAIVDRAAIGPDYLPGHAHADTLSFELSIFNNRVVVNSGTSMYGSGTNRQQERSTSAHSTVVIDGHDSSEVWAGFRVARRAKVFNSFKEELKDVVRLKACHNGYKRLPGAPVHCREWIFKKDSLTIFDKIIGAGSHKIESILHLHPKVNVRELKGNQAELEIDNNNIRVSIDGNGELNNLKSYFHPEFGLSKDNRRLVFNSKGILPIEIITRITW